MPEEWVFLQKLFSSVVSVGVFKNTSFWGCLRDVMSGPSNPQRKISFDHGSCVINDKLKHE